MKKNYIIPNTEVLELGKDSLIATSVYLDGEADPNLKYDDETKNEYIWSAEDFTIQ